MFFFFTFITNGMALFAGTASPPTFERSSDRLVNVASGRRTSEFASENSPSPAAQTGRVKIAYYDQPVPFHCCAL